MKKHKIILTLLLAHTIFVTNSTMLFAAEVDEDSYETASLSSEHRSMA